MIINDLQYIESVDTSEVQGGSYYYERKADARASGRADAYGDDTYASSNTSVIADSDFGFSGARSDSSASAKSYW